jgi:hypothetical protein
VTISRYTRQDWLLIRSNLLWLGSAMLIAGVMLLAAQVYLYFSEQEKHALQLQLSQTRTSADAAEQAWQSVHAHRAEFEALKQRSVIGEERRLDWLEALAKYQQDHPHLALKYQFAAQQPLPQSEPINSFQVYASVMKVSYDAQDERDFSAFNAFLLGLPGLAAPVACTLQRSERVGVATQCEFAWLTIAAVKSEVVKP